MAKGSITAALFLALILNLAFFSALWGNKSLMLSSRDAASVMPAGAYHQEHYTRQIGRTPDPGAPAWTIEPWLKIVAGQYWQDHTVPLWNPYAAYGKPLAAAQQAQPFYPLAFLLSLHVSPRAYNFFLIARLFVGGLLMFLFARLFLEFLPSLAAAVTFMLSGYFIVFINMPHLSVEVLAPGVLLTFERILRGNCWLAVSTAAVMIFCASVGGMPESLFLVISYGTVYFLFRLFAEREFRKRPVSRLMKLGVALGLGFGASAFVLLPFAELARLAHDTHQVANLHGEQIGLAADSNFKAIALYLLPTLFGSIGNTTFFSAETGGTMMRAYWGMIPCLFAVTAICRSFCARDPLYPKTWRRLTVFFAVSLTLMLLKRFGSPAINWIGELPIADMVIFPKYDEPLMAFGVSMLTGIGFALVAERRLRPYYFPLAAILLTLLMLGLASLALPVVLPLTAHWFIYYGTLAAGVLVVLGALNWYAITAQPALVRWRMPGLLGLLTAELFANFVLPTFYLLNTLPSQASNPYQGAPYLGFLQTTDRDYSRVFGREGDLYPNWAGAFRLADVRSLDAMEYRPYSRFIRNFLLKPGDEARVSGELADRFTGSGDGYDYEFKSDEEKRFLALSSIKYLVSQTEYGVSSRVVDDIVAQHQSEKIWGFGKDEFPIGGGHEAAGLFEHPPRSRIAYKVKIDPNRPVFTGILSMKDAAQDRSDGVGFTLEIQSGDTIEPLLRTELDPRDVPADRDGHPFRVDLSQYAGQDVELLLSTDPGPRGDNTSDWAGWARLQFVPKDASTAKASPFKQIYDREVFVYEVAGVLPRAALYSAAEVLPDDQVLARLKAPGFDPQKKVVLGRESISPDDKASIRLFAAAPGSPVRAAQITAYEPAHVQIEAETDAPALLMLNDTDYPGWQATVNGTRVPIMRADYLFRGVMVPAGKSTVEFDYEPRSFRLGTEISAVSLFGVIALPLAFRRRRSQPPAA